MNRKYTATFALANAEKDEMLERSLNRLKTMQSDLEEARRLAENACTIVAAITLSAGGEIRLPYNDITELPKDATFDARFENGQLIIRCLA